MLKKWFETKLWKRILLALVLGVIVGSIFGEAAANLKWIGDVFIKLIRMIVVPLVFVTLVSGVVAMGSPSKLASIGAKTMGSFLLTTIGAITIGLFLAFLIQPGNGVSITGGEPQVLEAAIPLGERMMNIIPSNPIAALAEGDILAVIFFALLLGVGIMMSGKRAKPVADLMDSGSEVVLKITHLIMEVAPFGVFALIAAVAGTRGAGALLDVVPLALTILLGCFLHVIIVYGGIIRVVLGLPALRFFKDIVDAQLVAFSTSSSSATMPISIAVAEGNLGIKSPVASSVIPLGATVNMDGTAIYVGVVAVFTAQSFGIPLGLTDYALIALTTTIASIGTAAVPSASLFLLAGVLGVLGVTGEQTAIVVGFLLPFDRPLDMVRTTVNVTGNLAVCTAVAKWENEIDLDEFRRNPNI
ncbi:MAG: dicarboxylate/amino acid:cation symporter [Kordiimonadaceae bacterium]|jgi:Na+/H+-dicarboxylate symporter|nr:dicarboxylate/amino acid:cation symporter [Kordiimonadaceae bacterium]MBT6134746.1 dicarboxylate/amino acid:cation symporter [Kordiimonadaceae bacterium]MBT6466995.1 dicarboxylate/amino acid:cation symporter [Kordiimonadaceae bacterium]MBT7545114.1 dicarboxylate/amino acid:cation symporter [Kordiimonadaceae bacterium]MBT7605961.1 dicarboxylate/amino acid:cation symporter [Kordiimonadaceae bacterium]